MRNKILKRVLSLAAIAIISVSSVAFADVYVSYDAVEATGTADPGTRRVVARTDVTDGENHSFEVTSYAECRDSDGDRVGSSGWDAGYRWAKCTSNGGCNATEYGTAHSIAPADDVYNPKRIDYINGYF